MTEPTSLRYPCFYNQAKQLKTREFGQGTNIFASSIEDYLVSADEISQQILRPDLRESTRRIGAVKVRKYVLFPSTPLPVPTIIGGHASRRREDDKPRSGLRVVAGLAGAICGGYALFKLGQSFSHLKQASEELKKEKAFHKRIEEWNVQWRTFTHDLQESDVLEKLETISKHRENIFSRIRRKSNFDIFLLVGVVAAAVFAIIGAVFSCWFWLSASLGLGLVSGGGMLLKWGLDSAAKGHEYDAGEIKTNVKDLWDIQHRVNIPFQDAPSNS